AAAGLSLTGARSATEQQPGQEIHRPEQTRRKCYGEVVGRPPILARPSFIAQKNRGIGRAGDRVQNEPNQPCPPAHSRDPAQSTRMFLNCQGSSRSRSSGNRTSRSASGVQSPQTPTISPR